MSDILNLKEVAQLFKISEITARKWCVVGKLPAIKIGAHYRIRRKDIDNIFEEKIKDKNNNKYETINQTIPA